MQAVNSVGSIVGTVDPPLLPYIVIGQAVASTVPDLVSVVQSMIQGGTVTAAQQSALEVQIKGLANPASL